MIQMREWKKSDLNELVEIWNDVVEEGRAFPQEEELNVENGESFFSEQTFTGVAYREKTKEVVGLYILHPNNIGRCGHLANASYATKRNTRGKGIGEQLVQHSFSSSEEVWIYNFAV